MNDATKAPKKRAALGRGLGALLGDTQTERPVSRGTNTSEDTGRKDGLTVLPVASIEPHPENPRVNFDADALDDLARSIASRGVIQPVIVMASGHGRYRLVAGERRWRAAQKAQLHEIPAIVRDLADRDVAALALIENIQREDLNPVEEARAYHRLHTRNDMSQTEIARMVDKSRSHVANLMRLLALPEPVLTMVEANALSMGHARALINVDNAEEIAQTVVDDNLSVRDVEKLIRRRNAPVKEPRHRAARPGTRENDADILAIQKQLEEFLGLPIRIEPDGSEQGGAVTVRYKTLDQLDLVCQRLSGGEI
ncbi:ParB/RepB/Spo0J family partition protein [Croceicoccus sp. YJ47]|nr:ParB/RepB/Spo0J family partition protein [Croceicoccus sp. YJ47]QQN75731.1 ParB/RepB/Spo0J family partition protein [Croceicoccus sp. YJ47]